MSNDMTLVFCLHGLNGTYADFSNLVKMFNKKHKSRANSPTSSSNVKRNDSSAGDEQAFMIVSLKANSNSAFATHDGVENGAARFLNEIIEHFNKIPTTFDRVRVTFVCHSLGGIYGRYVLKLLCDQGYFRSDSGLQSRFIPDTFITMATPHLSARKPPTSMFNKVFQGIGTRLTASIRELLMTDIDQEGHSLLYKMATRDEYLNPLKQFRRRILYANVFNDFQVPFCTANIAPFNPYAHKEISKRAPLICEKKFRHITEWSLANRHNKHWEDNELNFFATTDALKEKILEMMVSLNNDISWERYHCLFPTVFAHEQIIGKRSILPGKKVLHHLIDICDEIFVTTTVMSSL